jgi:hypothetical protein
MQVFNTSKPFGEPKRAPCRSLTTQVFQGKHQITARPTNIEIATHRHLTRNGRTCQHELGITTITPMSQGIAKIEASNKNASLGDPVAIS